MLRRLASSMMLLLVLGLASNATAQQISGTLQISNFLPPRVDFWSMPPSGATLTVQSQTKGLEAVPYVSVKRDGTTLIATSTNDAPTITLSAGKNKFGLNDLVRPDSLTVVGEAFRRRPISGFVLEAGTYQLCVDLQGHGSGKTLLSLCSPLFFADVPVNFGDDTVRPPAKFQTNPDYDTTDGLCEDDVKTVLVNINVFQKSDGSNNFQDTPADRAAIYQIMEWVNGTYRFNSKPSDPIPGVIDLPDTKVRFELDDRIYFYQDDTLNISHDSGTLQAAVAAVDPSRLNQLNIYLTEGSCCKGAGGFAVLPDFTDLTFDQYIVKFKAYDGYVSGVGLYADAESLTHELGHTLNLKHPYDNGDPNQLEPCASGVPHFEFLDDVFNMPPNEICPLMSGWSAQPWAYQNWDASGKITVPFPPDTSDNDIMDGTQSATYTSPKQISRFHNALCHSSLSRYVKAVFPSEWRQFRSDSKHSGINDNESTITKWSVGNLTVKWSDPNATGNSSPAVVEDSPGSGLFRLYIGTDYNTVLAYDATGSGCTVGTCNPIWARSFTTDSAFNSSPAVGYSWNALYPDQLFIAGDHTVEALGSGGASLWSGQYGGSAGFPAVSSSPTLAFADFGKGATSGVFVGSTDGHVYAFDATNCLSQPTCAPAWISQTWPDPKLHLMFSSPAVANNMVYIGEIGGDGGITAYNAKTGSIVWGNHQTIGGVNSSPTVVDGVVYFGATWYTGAGYVYALDASSGAQKWRLSASGGVSSSPAYSNGIVYIGSQTGNLYGIDASSGLLLCSASIGPIGYSSPVVANGVLYIGSEDGNLYAFDADSCPITGTLPQLLKLPLGYGSPLESSPTVANGMVYVESPDGLFAMAPQ
jgi:outer membrane protein assembly factor BamB